MRCKADLAEVFASVNHSLEPGGTFVFDINHPAQLARFWRNQPAAGEIADSYAWLITPRYDANTAKGAFRVDMYVQPEGQEPRLAAKIVDLLSRNRFLWRLKLRRLARFGASHPQWEHKSSDYPIYGHDLNTVMDMLGKAGFDPTLQTLECSPNVTERDAAFFVCTKTAETSRVQEAAE